MRIRLPGLFAMVFFRVFRLGFYLLSASLFLTTGISANNIATEDQEEWLKSVHESWSKEDSEFKDSPTSPLAGTSRFEISETNTIYFAEKDGQVRSKPEVCVNCKNRKI